MAYCDRDEYTGSFDLAHLCDLSCVMRLKFIHDLPVLAEDANGAIAGSYEKAFRASADARNFIALE